MLAFFQDSLEQMLQKNLKSTTKKSKFADNKKENASAPPYPYMPFFYPPPYMQPN